MTEHAKCRLVRVHSLWIPFVPWFAYINSSFFFSFFFFCVLEKVPCSLSLPQTFCEAEDNLELLIFLFPLGLKECATILTSHGAGDRTQGCVCTRQTLYQLSSFPSLRVVRGGGRCPWHPPLWTIVGYFVDFLSCVLSERLYVIITQVLHFNELSKSESKDPNDSCSKDKREVLSDSSLEGQKQTPASQEQQVSLRLKTLLFDICSFCLCCAHSVG